MSLQSEMEMSGSESDKVQRLSLRSLYCLHDVLIILRKKTLTKLITLLLKTLLSLFVIKSNLAQYLFFNQKPEWEMYYYATKFCNIATKPFFHVFNMF